MQVYVEISEVVDEGGMKGKPKPRKKEITEDDKLIIAGFGTVSRPGARAVPIMWFF
jgi:hypothetical protein